MKYKFYTWYYNEQEHEYMFVIDAKGPVHGVYSNLISYFSLTYKNLNPEYAQVYGNYDSNHPSIWPFNHKQKTPRLKRKDKRECVMLIFNKVNT
jgi:hypothetical protein